MALNLPGVASTVSKFASSSVSKAAGSVFDILDPANARRAISGLFAGGTSSSKTPKSPDINFQQADNAGADAESDWRVRVSLAAEGAEIFYKDATNSLLNPLRETSGVIFPYTPQIQITHQAIYNSSQLTHSNYSSHFYQGSEVNDITITGDFTVQSIGEGQYLLAAIYFFRAATKMFFGQGSNAGNPPPMVYLDGYGSHYFPHVPCVISSFQHTLPNEVDYIEIPISKSVYSDQIEVPTEENNFGSVQNAEYVPSLLDSSKEGTKKVGSKSTKSGFITTVSKTRVPAASSISITLKPIYSRKNVAQRFDLDKFANGDLLRDDKNGFGGFL